MGKKHSQDQEETSGRHSSSSNKRERSPEETIYKFEGLVDFQDLGAGYDAEDNKNVTKAIKIYNEKLLPFIQENQTVFARSGFLKLRGYATSIGEPPKQPELSSLSHRSSPTKDLLIQDDRLDRHRHKRPRHST